MARLLLAALLLLLAVPLRAANYTDLWWNADESGWGVTLVHQNDKVFGVWYVYDASGKPLWIVMPWFGILCRKFSRLLTWGVGRNFQAGIAP